MVIGLTIIAGRHDERVQNVASDVPGQNQVVGSFEHRLTPHRVRGTVRRAVHRGIIFALTAALLAVATGSGRAAEALNPPIPFDTASAVISPGNVSATLVAAQRAQELGMSALAVSLYQELLVSPGADRAGLTLPLVTALLDAGRAAEAEQALNGMPGGRSAEWRLRYGLAAAQQRKFDVANDQLRQIDVDSLTRPDRAWFWFLTALLADTANPPDHARADDNYAKAQREAATDLARSMFLIARLRVQLRLKSYTADHLELARQAYERYRDKGSLAYGSAESYAVMSDALGRKSEAVRFLSELLVRMPRAERQATDRFRWLLGIIGDRSRGGQGRNALNQLLEMGNDADIQRQALQLLVQDSGNEPERGLFRAEVDKVLAMVPRSAIFDSLLLARAQLALTDKDYVNAERRANQLRDDFPGSPLRPHAFVVLASSALEQHRYRVAADNARQARESLEASPAATAQREAKVTAQHIGELRVFEAEARFRAQDFRVAADAYAAALRNPPAGVAPGELMFQRALAFIKANADDKKVDLTKVVDELETDPRFDSTNRWETEWSLARGLMLQEKTEAALARVTRLLDASADVNAVNPELRAKMAWLQMRLSFEAGRFELTLQLVPKLQTMAAGLSAELRTEIESQSALMKAESEFKLDRESAALATLDKLRTEFPKTDAASNSFLVTAAHYAEPGRDKIQDAQMWLGKLIDSPDYKQSPYVPWALFQLALLSERLGQEKDLRQSNERIEELVRPDRDPPASPDLVFTARLKQGDLLRTLNEYPLAQTAYESLVNNPKYAQRPDVMVAQLRLAECHNAMSSTDVSGAHADLAQSLFEELLYRVSAPADVRVEAGYNLGKILERRGQFDKARDVWWRDVITPVLIEAKWGDSTRAGTSYWLARTLLDLGTLFEQRENIDDARRVYGLLRDSHLGFDSVGLDQLQRLGLPPPLSPKK